MLTFIIGFICGVVVMAVVYYYNNVKMNKIVEAAKRETNEMYMAIKDKLEKDNKPPTTPEVK